MNERRVMFVFLKALFLAIVGGLICQSVSAASELPVVARIHWLGLNQISADTNSANFMKIWRLPESAALEKQTLDKLSYWLAGGKTNAASAKLRPLLDDFVSSEFYLEIRAATNDPSAGSSPRPTRPNCQLLLALHLPADHSQLWQTNLAAAVGNLTGNNAVSTQYGWRIQGSHLPEEIEYFRKGEWTIVGVGPDMSELLPQFSANYAFAASSSLRNNPASRSKSWLECDVDVSHFSICCPLNSGHFFGVSPNSKAGEIFAHFQSLINHVNFSVSGSRNNVSTSGTISLTRQISGSLLTWELPTNLISQSIRSFTAVRGLSSLLSDLPGWRKLQLSTPDQAFLWAGSGIPFQAYCASPLALASNQLLHLSRVLTKDGNPWLARVGQGTFQWQPNLPGITWNGALLLTPWMKVVNEPGREWVLGGLYPVTQGENGTLPPSILDPLLNTKGLIYYQAEQTGLNVDADLFITQLFRMIFHKPQLSSTAAATAWLKHIEPLLGGSTTEIIRARPEQLVFKRTSSVGLTALELHLMADWLESPAFPNGLHTFAAPLDK